MVNKYLIVVVIVLVLLIADDIAYQSPYDIRVKECKDYGEKGDEEFYKYREVEYGEGGREHLEKSMAYNEKAISCWYTVYPLVTGGVFSHIIPFKWTFTTIINEWRK